MPDYTPSEVVDILLVLGECRGNYRREARLYGDRYGHLRHRFPNDRAIAKLERRARQGRLKRQKIVRNFNPEAEGRAAAVNIAVLAMFAMNPHLSLRKVQTYLGVSKSTAQRILKASHLRPYRISLHQQLSDQDHVRRVAFCRWATGQIRRNPHFPRYLLMSDEATFQSDGHLNRWNSRYWSVDNPHWMRQIDHQHRWKLNVWCGIVNGYLVGPYFFEGPVTGQGYLDFLQNALPELLQEVDLDTRARMWFQQDGVPPHYHRIVRNYLQATYGGNWIGRGGPVEWPPRSPDLTSPDFFLWGFLKDVVYREPPTSRVDMMNRITNACRAIPRAILLKTVQSFEKRVRACLALVGGIFEHL